MKKVTIVGFGRFGKVLYRLLKDDFQIIIYNRHPVKDVSQLLPNTKVTNKREDIYKSEVIFYCVPIAVFEEVITKDRKFITDNHLLIDVLSVKMHPEKVFRKYLKNKKTESILTHPMFGPDSSKFGFAGLPLIMNQFKSSRENFLFWKKYFQNKGLKIIELPSKTHDRLAANSQGLTHFTGRLLAAFGLKPTPIDSLGAKKLLEVKEQTCNDSWQLFENLQHYNPYTKAMRAKLGACFDKLYNQLLPEQINRHFLTIGIQGGRGSFNEEAVHYYLKRGRIEKYKIKYLYTTEAVLKALHLGEIDCGQFAVFNSQGGIVEESILAMAKYKFKILDKFAIKISHALLIRSDAQLSDITAIMTHPQVLLQCRENLLQKYPHLKQTSGQGKLIDHSGVAKELAAKKLPKNIATMGSKVLAKIYNLKIVEDNLQDLKENFTTFLFVKRR